MADRGLLPTENFLKVIRTELGGAGGLRLNPETRAVRLSELSAGPSARSGGLNAAHVKSLIETESPLPPILVHRDSMQVIDGQHRIAATAARGLAVIEAHLLSGPGEFAYLLGVCANVSHGLPLSLADRRGAALKIVEMHGDWSDRSIAICTGLSPKTVKRVRSATAARERLHTLGSDGRRRPLDPSAARLRAAEILASTPDASLREVAKAVGLSAGTVRDVRMRLARGDSPAAPPTRQRLPNFASTGGLNLASVAVACEGSSPTTTKASPQEIPLALRTLSRDPALRMSESGRDLLRWLHSHAVSTADGARFVTGAPDHCVERLMNLAREFSTAWGAIANDLQARTRLAQDVAI